MLEKILALSLMFNPFNLDNLHAKQYVLLNQNPTPIYANASEQSLVGSNCGTLQEIDDNTPSFSPDDLVVRIDYETRTKTHFLIYFYKRNNTALDKPIDPIKLMDRKDFEAFVIYELNEKGLPNKNSTASGYFKGPFMLGLYDFFTREGNELSNPVPDGYVEHPFCYITEGTPISSLIFNILGTIAEKRGTQLKK